ncbi:MAG: TatD family deoxyribonuclease [Clostridia bacterium]|nr:TatD family deoxyribonuclease [Clostridia bacterium]
MMKNIFDSHAHYDDESFDNDREQVLNSLFNGSVCGIINCGVDIKTSILSLELAKKYDGIYAACGIHPQEASDAKDDCFDKLYELLKEPKVVAVGEIGLDYHYDFSPRDIQIKVLEKQLQIANELDMPVIIHDRESHEDILNLLKQYKPKGVVHCFSGSVEMANEILKLGMYIGLGGAVTFKNAKKPVQVAQVIPIDRLLLETDAPYMTPVPFRGTRCTSDLISFTAEKIAQIREITADELLAQTIINTKSLFNI